MSKRFCDVNIWRQDWFIEMPYEYMFLWFYVLDTCDHAGIWKPHKKFIEIICKKEIDLKKALDMFNLNKQRIEILKNNRWFVCDFIFFQYGNTLNPANPFHRSIIKTLKENEVSLTSIRGLGEVKETTKDKEKVKDKVKEKDKDLINKEGGSGGKDEKVNWDNCKTDLQRLISYYIKTDMPSLYQSATQDQATGIFKRYGKAGSEILQIAGSLDVAIKAYNRARRFFSEKGLAWNLSTVAKHIGDHVDTVLSKQKEDLCP